MPSKVRITQRTIKQFLNANDYQKKHFLLKTVLSVLIKFGNKDGRLHWHLDPLSVSLD